MSPAESVLNEVEVSTERTVVLEVERAREAFVPVSEAVDEEDVDVVAIETDVVFISVIIVGEFSAFEVPEEVADCVDVSGCLEVEVVVECTTCAGAVLVGAFDVVVDVVITGGFTILGFMSSEKSCASSNMKLALPLLVTTTVCVSNSKMVGDW